MVDTQTEDAKRELRARIKQVLIESLSLEGTTPEMIGDDTPLFGDEGLGLDSVDALELMVVFEKDFGIEVDIEEVGPEAFATVASMEKLIHDQLQGAGAA